MGKKTVRFEFQVFTRSKFMNESKSMNGLYDMKWWLVLFVLSLNPKQLLATGMGGCWWRQNTSIASQMADSSYSFTTFSMSVWAQAIFIRIKKSEAISLTVFINLLMWITVQIFMRMKRALLLSISFVWLVNNSNPTPPCMSLSVQINNQCSHDQLFM